MARTDQMANDILYALSMYFAASLKDQLLATHENAWACALVGAVFALHVRVDTWYRRRWGARAAVPGKPAAADAGLFGAVVTEAVDLVTRTLAFLFLQVVIATVTEGTVGASSGFWHEAVVLPCLLLVLGMAAVTVAKRYAAPAAAA